MTIQTTDQGREEKIRSEPVEVLSNRQVAHDLYQMQLRVPPDWDTPRPGQFVSLTLEPPWRETQAGSAGDALLRRPFSIAGWRSGGKLPQLTVLYAPVGRITERMRDLEPPATVSLLGPAGTAYPLPSGRHPVLVGGGRGIAPLLFVAQTLRDRGAAFDLIYGARSARDWVPLGTLARRAMLAAEDGSGGVRGTVIDLLEQAQFPPSAMLLACGPHAMLDAVSGWADRHALECWVSVEAVFGCSIGICGGCAVPARGGTGAYDRFLWACREGPVVSAGRIDWDAWRKLDA